MFDGEHTIEHTDIELYCTTEVYVISPSYLALEGKKVYVNGFWQLLTKIQIPYRCLPGNCSTLTPPHLPLDSQTHLPSISYLNTLSSVQVTPVHTTVSPFS